MPRLSVWFVRLALVYLGLGFTLGALLLLSKGQFLTPALYRYRPLHVELLLIGWVVQFAIGVSYWILPRLNETNERGPEAVVRFALLALNTGVLTACVGFLLAREQLLLVGRVLEVSAVIGYAIYLRPRLMRPASGE